MSNQACFEQCARLASSPSMRSVTPQHTYALAAPHNACLNLCSFMLRRVSSALWLQAVCWDTQGSCWCSQWNQACTRPACQSICTADYSWTCDAHTSPQLHYIHRYETGSCCTTQHQPALACSTPHSLISHTNHWARGSPPLPERRVSALAVPAAALVSVRHHSVEKSAKAYQVVWCWCRQILKTAFAVWLLVWIWDNQVLCVFSSVPTTANNCLGNIDSCLIASSILP